MATVTSSKRHLVLTSDTYTSNGDVVVGGDLTIQGTTTTLDTANLLVEDKNIIIGNVSSPSDTTADGGGITLKGATDKTISWSNANNRWDFNQGITSSGDITAANLSGTNTGNNAANTHSSLFIDRGSIDITTASGGSNSNPFDDAHTETKVAENGMRTINYTGAGAFMYTFNNGGSASVVQIGAHYNGDDYYLRTRTDSSNWKTWKKIRTFGNTTIPTVPDSYAPTDAEANVQANWTEATTTSDAFILNKPSTFPPSSHTHDVITHNSTNYIDVHDHSDHTWFRNSTGSWTFQTGDGGDNWTQTYMMHLPAAGSTANAVMMELGQRNSNEANGRYKGVRIVKYAGSAVADGDLTAANISATSSLSVTGTITSQSTTVVGTTTIQSAVADPGDLLHLNNQSNGAKATIKFTDQATSITQYGRISFGHVNTDSYGSGAYFSLGSTESSTTILADGKLMYAEGIYSKPSSGTGAGTRRDSNWNTAYTHSQATHAPTDAEANVQADWTEATTTSDAFILNKPSTFPPSAHNHDSSYVKLTSSGEQEISGDVLFNDTVQFDGDVQNITSTTAVNIQTSGGAMLVLKDTNSAGVAANPYINFVDSANTRQGYVGIGSGSNAKLYLEGLGGIQTNNPLSVSGSLTVSTTGDFAGKVNFQGDAAIEGGSGYGVFKGYTGNDNHFISVRGIVANTATTTITGGHQTTFVEHADSVSEGWYFKSKTTGTYREIARIDGTNQMFLGGNKVWNAGNDGSGSGLDADTVDGSHANPSYGAGKQYDFTVNGNADIFYPVVINGASSPRMTRITVFRSYSETAPSTWNTASHKGGLTLDMEIRVGGWGGYPNMINVHDFGEIYSRICGGAYYTAHTMKFVVWLRGGGASYHIDSPNTNLSIEVNDSTSAENYVTGTTGNGTWYSYDHSNASYDVTVSARDLADADIGAKALLAYMPIRYNGSQNKVISGVSLPTSLDATTVDGINSSSFLRSDANDSASGNINFSGAIGLTSTNNTLNGHLYYNAHDAAGNHYPHFKDGSDNGGTTINWRQYYGSTYKTHTWASDSSGNMVFDFKGQYKGDSLRIDGVSEFIGHVNVGSASDTSNRDLYLHGSTANKKSRLRTTNGNLHIDSAEGHALYLNYYYGAATNIMFGNGNGGYCGTVSSAGILRMSGDVVAYYSFSDRRLKTNIKTTENNLDKILSLNPVEYTWKEGPREGVKEIGLIAQEVEEVVPEVVRVQSRHHDEKEEGEEYKQVDYEHLVSTLIGAMQEQQKQIDELKSQISVLNIKNCKCKK